MCKTIEYFSPEAYPPSLDDITFPAVEKDGLKWEWKLTSGLSIDKSTGYLEECVFLSWKFDWDELRKTQNVNGFEGRIDVKWKRPFKNYGTWAKTELAVDLDRSGGWIQKKITTMNDAEKHKTFCFNFELEPVKKTAEVEHFESIFGKSDVNDVALVVEGSKKMHVNKALLSYHSEYFRAMFSSDFQEKSMKEIPIEDVKYEDFAALLSLITYPALPTADNIAKILELADRFLMRSVNKMTELYIWNIEDLKFETLLLLASKYDMDAIKKKCCRMLSSQEEIKRIMEKEEFEQLDDALKIGILKSGY